MHQIKAAVVRGRNTSTKRLNHSLIMPNTTVAGVIAEGVDTWLFNRPRPRGFPLGDTRGNDEVMKYDGGMFTRA